MTYRLHRLSIVLWLGVASVTWAQDEQQPADSPAKSSSPSGHEAASPEPSGTDQFKESVKKITSQTEEEAAKIARTVDQDPNAKTAAAGILQPIYWLAETISFPAFHWLAFALMAAGVISFALQLLLGKLVVLMRMGFSLKEIISDAAGLAISIVGLVLTTQAATENSTFTQSPAAVISATAVGVIFGSILYLWGQKQELEAAAGRTVAARKVK